MEMSLKSDTQKSAFTPYERQGSAGSNHLDPRASDNLDVASIKSGLSVNSWDIDTPTPVGTPKNGRSRAASVGGWMAEDESGAPSPAELEEGHGKKKKEKKKGSIKKKHTRNEVFEFTDSGGSSRVSASDRDSESGHSDRSRNEKRKKYKSIFQRALKKIISNKKHGNESDAGEADWKGTLPPRLGSVDLDVELSPPKVASYLKNETGEGMLMENRRTSNAFYKKWRSSSQSSFSLDLTPKGEEAAGQGEKMLAEAVLSARARGRRVSLGGWFDHTDSEDTAAVDPLSSSLDAGTWMADLQLAKNTQLLQEALNKEDIMKKKAKSSWKKALKKVKGNSRKRTKTWQGTEVETLDHISEASNSLASSMNNSMRFIEGFPSQSQEKSPARPKPLKASWNNLTEESENQPPKKDDLERNAVSDTESLPSLRMGWIETKDSPKSDLSNDDDDILEKNKSKKKTKKKMKKEKSKEKKSQKSPLHTTSSLDVLAGIDPNELRRESSGDLSKSMSSVEMKHKKRFGNVFRRAVSKITKMKKEGKSFDAEEWNVNEKETVETPASSHGFNNDNGFRSRRLSSLSRASSELLGTSDLEALSSNDEAFSGMFLASASNTPSPKKKKLTKQRPKVEQSTSGSPSSSRDQSPGPPGAGMDFQGLSKSHGGGTRIIQSTPLHKAEDASSIHSGVPTIEIHGEDNEDMEVGSDSVFSSRNSSFASENRTSTGGNDLGSSAGSSKESSMVALTLDDLTVDRPQVSSHSESAILAMGSVGLDLKPPNLDMKSSSDTEDHSPRNTTKNKKRRGSLFGRMFGSNSGKPDDSSRSTSPKQGFEESGESGLRSPEHSKPAGKLKPLKKKKKKRSKSTSSALDGGFEDNNDDLDDHVQDVFQKEKLQPIRDKRMRSKSGPGGLAQASGVQESGSLNFGLDADEERRMVGEEHADAPFPDGNQENSHETSGHPDLQRLSSNMSVNSSTAPSDNDSLNIESVPAKARKRRSSLGKALSSLWRKKPKHKKGDPHPDDPEMDTKSKTWTPMGPGRGHEDHDINLDDLDADLDLDVELENSQNEAMLRLTAGGDRLHVITPQSARLEGASPGMHSIMYGSEESDSAEEFKELKVKAETHENLSREEKDGDENGDEDSNKSVGELKKGLEAKEPAANDCDKTMGDMKACGDAKQSDTNGAYNDVIETDDSDSSGEEMKGVENETVMNNGKGQIVDKHVVHSKSVIETDTDSSEDEEDDVKKENIKIVGNKMRIISDENRNVMESDDDESISEDIEEERINDRKDVINDETDRATIAHFTEHGINDEVEDDFDGHMIMSSALHNLKAVKQAINCLVCQR